MSDSSRTTVRQEIYKDWGWLGFAATADDIGADYIEDESEFGHERYGPNELSDRFAYRFNRTGEDRVRQTLTVDTATGRLSVDGNTSYVNTSDLDYEITGLHPDEINAQIMKGQEDQVDRQFWPVSAGKDGNMERADVNYWDSTSGGSEVSSAAVSKVTDEANVYIGPQALYINPSGAGGYCRSQRYRVSAGKRCDVGFIGRVDGTFTFRVYDATNSAYLTNGQTYSGEDFVAMFAHITVPSNCYEIQLQWTASASSDDIYISCILGPYVAERRQFELPEEYAEGYNVKGIRTVRYLSQLGDETFDAYSREWTGELDYGADFQIESFHRSANPYHLSLSAQLYEHWFHYGLWAVGERPLSEVEPLDSESATTSAPLRQVVAHAKARLAVVIRDRNPDEPQWQNLVAETRIDKAVEKLSRPPVPKVETRGRRRIRA